MNNGRLVTQAVANLTKRDRNGVEGAEIVRVAKSEHGWKEALKTLRVLVSTAESEVWAGRNLAEVLRDVHMGNGKQPRKE